MQSKNILYRGAIFVTLLLVLVPNILFASVFKGDEDIAVSKDEIIRDDLYVFGNYSEVRGTVEGDLSAFCYDISFNGDILGNSNVFAYNIDFIGKVKKSARLFGYKIRINGPVDGNLIAYGKDIRLGGKSIIGRDLTYAGDDVRIDGVVLGNIDGSGVKTVISATIDGNICIETERLIITSPAVIKGELCYTSPEEAIIDEDVIVEGEIIWKEKHAEAGDDSGRSSGIVTTVLFLMSLVTGFILIMLFRNHFNEAILQIESRFWYTLAIGCLSFITLTFGALIPAVLIVGIPFSIMMLFLGAILFYIGKIYVGISLARYLFRLISRESKLPIGLELLIGLIILTILFQIPFLGWIIYIVTFLLGTGAAVNGFMALCRKQKIAQST